MYELILTVAIYSWWWIRDNNEPAIRTIRTIGVKREEGGSSIIRRFDKFFAIYLYLLIFSMAIDYRDNW